MPRERVLQQSLEFSGQVGRQHRLYPQGDSCSSETARACRKQQVKSLGLCIQREVCGLTYAFELEISRNLKENEAEGARAESTHNNQQNQSGLLLYLCYVFRVLINPPGVLIRNKEFDRLF